MNFDTPLVEYLIIGAHTFSWLILLGMKILKIPLNSVLYIEPAKVLLLLPVIYLLGMMVDDLAFRPLNKARKRIQAGVFKSSKNYKDEMIAYHSPELYQAYEARVRRVRIIGAAIFNWPLLGVAILLHIGFANTLFSSFIIIFVLFLFGVSITTWSNLYTRAYEFRKKAIDTIKEYASLNEKDK